MNGRRAKAIRRMVFGDDAYRWTLSRLGRSRTMFADGLRGAYKQAKRLWKREHQG